MSPSERALTRHAVCGTGYGCVCTCVCVCSMTVSAVRRFINTALLKSQLAAHLGPVGFKFSGSQPLPYKGLALQCLLSVLLVDSSQISIKCSDSCRQPRPMWHVPFLSFNLHDFSFNECRRYPLALVTNPLLGGFTSISMSHWYTTFSVIKLYVYVLLILYYHNII